MDNIELNDLPAILSRLQEQALAHCRDWARAQGGVWQIIVCAQKDVPKSTMLQDLGAEVASQ